MALLGLIYVLLVGGWAFLLPAWLVSRLIVPAVGGAERLGLVCIVGFSTYPLMMFLSTAALGIPMDAGWLLVVASAMNFTLGWREHSRGSLAMDISWLELRWPLVGLVAVSLLLIFGVRSLDAGDVFSTVHHCLYVIAMYAIGNDPASSVPLYDAVSGGVMHYVIQHPTTEFNGLAPLFYEQRIGNAPIVAPPVALFGTIGWLISPITSLTTLGMCGYLAARACGASGRASALSTAVVVYGMAIFTGYHINENTFAVALVAFLLWSALRGRLTLGWAVLCGVSVGHLIGVRYTSSLFLPGVMLGILWATPHGCRRSHLLLGAVAGGLVAVSPWLYINWIMLGNPLGHPKVHSNFAARVVDNSIFGMTFKFRALNFPFTDQVVRTAWNPFPTFLWLPLQVGRSFGQLAVAAGWVGLYRCFARPGRMGWILVVFALPHNIAMMLLESLDWEQLTYAAPGIVPLGPALALGLEPLLMGRVSFGPRVRRAAPVLLVLAAMIAVGFAVRDYRAPVDMRRLNQVGCTPPASVDQGVEAMAEILTTPSLLPPRPKLRTQLASDAVDGLSRVGLLGSDRRYSAGRPLYPSGQAAILVAYSARERATYDIVIEGRDPRTSDTPIRSSLGLHMVTLKLPAERVRFTVSRRGGEAGEGAVGETYDIRAVVETPSEQERDFTLWIHPWNPPVQEMSIVVLENENARADDPNQPTGMVDVHLLSYGSTEPGEQRFILTNYDSSVIDIVDIPLEVDTAGEPGHWGLGLFLRRTDSRHVETLVLSGGHDMSWTGGGVTTPEILKVPRPLYADEYVLYSEPYCSDHVPQYGDRYGVVKGPFNGEPIRVKFDRMWLPWQEQ